MCPWCSNEENHVAFESQRNLVSENVGMSGREKMLM